MVIRGVARQGGAARLLGEVQGLRYTMYLPCTYHALTMHLPAWRGRAPLRSPPGPVPSTRRVAPPRRTPPGTRSYEGGARVGRLGLEVSSPGTRGSTVRTPRSRRSRHRPCPTPLRVRVRVRVRVIMRVEVLPAAAACPAWPVYLAVAWRSGRGHIAPAPT
eukprot:scaffold25752_cov36-Phaeocystis_antarctica.AAC.1